MSTPPRPKWHEPSIKRAAVEALLPQVKEWLGDGHESDEETLRDLIAAADDDAYSFARKLDDKYWSPDAELVEILTGFSIYPAHQKAIKAWVIENGVTVTQTIGDIVTLRGEQARVVAIHPETAEIVAQPVIPDGRNYGETGGWVHPTEDAVPAPSVSEEQ